MRPYGHFDGYGRIDAGGELILGLERLRMIIDVLGRKKNDGLTDGHTILKNLLDRFIFPPFLGS